MIDLVISNEPDSELSSMLKQASHKDLRASLLMIVHLKGLPWVDLRGRNLWHNKEGLLVAWKPIQRHSTGGGL
jgi:hypothetical protein